MKSIIWRKLILLVFITNALALNDTREEEALDVEMPLRSQRSLEVKQTESSLKNVKNKMANENRKMAGNEGFGPFMGGLQMNNVNNLVAARPPGQGDTQEGDANPQGEQSNPMSQGMNNGMNMGMMGPMGMMGGLGPLMASSVMMNSAFQNPALNPMGAAMSNTVAGRPNFIPVDDEGLPDDDNGFNYANAVDVSAEVYDDASGLRVVNKCNNVKAQAIEIANRIMKKQNSKVFKELLAYLVKSKFLIGMTEIKLARSLRKRVFALMGAFSSLSHREFNFLEPMNETTFEFKGDVLDAPTSADESEPQVTVNYDAPQDSYGGNSLSKSGLDKSFANESYPEIDQFIRKDFSEGKLSSLNKKKSKI